MRFNLQFTMDPNSKVIEFGGRDMHDQCLSVNMLFCKILRFYHQLTQRRKSLVGSAQQVLIVGFGERI